MKRFIIAAAAAAALAVCLILCAVPVRAAAVSGTDAVVSSADAAYFDRVSVVPVNVEIPPFYKQVTNIAGMYIFTTPDGVVHKRIYGALNGVYGWYIPRGADNVVPINAQQVDIKEDVKYYNDMLRQLEDEPTMQDFAGILPPEEGTYGVDTLFGYPIRSVILCCAGVLLFCCFCTMVACISISNRRRRTRQR